MDALLIFGGVMGIGVIVALLFAAKPVYGEDMTAAPSDKVKRLAEAISVAEGSPFGWNNPGDLTKSFGYATLGVGNSAGVLKFATPQDGWNALYAQLNAIILGQSHWSLDTTLEDFGLGYSGGDSNWAVNVANQLGIDTSVTLREILL
jgi:hypothetical protein